MLRFYTVENYSIQISDKTIHIDLNNIELRSATKYKSLQVDLSNIELRSTTKYKSLHIDFSNIEIRTTTYST